jgi:hypothetical protein
VLDEDSGVRLGVEAAAEEVEQEQRWRAGLAESAQAKP